MLRRGRGLLLRFARRRPLAIAIGLALAAPAVWIESRATWEAWWVPGVALVCGATGAALLWTGLTGVLPDFVDPDKR